jgi:hypothetical protein
VISWLSHFDELYRQACEYHRKPAVGAQHITIVSGGQTGPDRAALDVAMALGLPYGGFCPKGGWAEDMPNPPGLLHHYSNMEETKSSELGERTRLNVEKGDATLIVVDKSGLDVSPGTILTLDLVKRANKRHLVIDVHQSNAVELLEEWLESAYNLKVLNVAGPRESEAPGLYALTRALLAKVLRPRADQMSPGPAGNPKAADVTPPIG